MTSPILQPAVNHACVILYVLECVWLFISERAEYIKYRREKRFTPFSCLFHCHFDPYSCQGRRIITRNPLLMSDKAVRKQNIPTQCTRMTSDSLRHFQLMRGEPEGLGARLTSTGSLMRRSGFVDMRYFVPPSRASGNLGIAKHLATLTCWDLDKLLYQLNSAHLFEFR